MNVSPQFASALVAVVLLVASAGTSSAGIASARDSHVEIAVGSASGGTPELRIVAREATYTPIADEPVHVDFSRSTLRLFSVQDDGVTVDCAARRLTKFTNLYGEAVFHPRFGGSEAGANLYIDVSDVLIGIVAGRSTDLDGIGGGTSLGDFALFSSAFGDGMPHAEVNFDRSASDLPDLADFTIFAGQMAGGVVAAYCP